jgi:queuine tRNA-ribosyltransferase
MIETAHGPLRLPAYFPDATRAVVRSVDSRDLEACGVQGVVVNAFHLSAHPGAGLLKRAGGVHAFMGWHRPVASDSGGFQMMSMIRENPRYGTVSARGIHFVDADGTRERTLFTPERSIRLQFDLRADLMICLDDCPSPTASRDEVAVSVERTVQWARRCRAEFDRLLASRKKDTAPRPLLFGVVQGGYDPALRRGAYAVGVRRIWLWRLAAHARRRLGEGNTVPDGQADPRSVAQVCPGRRKTGAYRALLPDGLAHL